MSDATERPDVDDDAWADACAEDLAAEKARRRAQHGPPPGSAAEELRKLLGAVADKVSEFQNSLPGVAAQSAVQQLVSQARSAVEPVIERNPQVFDHLAAAGGELLAAYRSAVEGQERRWTQGAADTSAPSQKSGDPRDDDPRDGRPGTGEQIDLD
jgi:ABC-type transporter Mla subunit MlaD